MIINNDGSSDVDHSGRIWLHAFYHSVVVCIGAGALALPFATSHLGYIGAVVVALLVSSGSYYTATLLISLQTPDQGTYSEVADAIMGGTWFSRRVVRPFQLLYLFPISAVFLVLGGNAMYEMDKIINGNTAILSEKVYVSIMSIVVFCLSLLPDLSSAWQISLLGFVSAIVIVLYASIGPIVLIANHQNEDVNHNGRPDDTNLTKIMGIFSAIGNFIFAWGYHVVMPDIQASLHDHATVDAHGDMMKATTFAYSLSTPFFIMISLVGYAAYGDDVAQEVLDSFYGHMPDAALIVLWMFIIFKVATEGSVFNMGAFTLIRDMFKLSIEEDHVDHHPRNKKIDFVCRFLWVAAATLVAMYMPLFSDLQGLTGAISTTPLSFIIPVILWNRMHRDTVPKWRLIAHYTFMAIFIILATCAFIGVIYDVIKNIEDGTLYDR